MYPILWRFWGGFLYSYTAVWLSCILLGIGQTAWLNRRFHYQLPHWFDAVLAALVGGLLGGRLGFVLVNQSYFNEYPSEAWQLWRGGV
jgi:prolipoprotein diacylglyceryltransferase